MFIKVNNFEGAKVVVFLNIKNYLTVFLFFASLKVLPCTLIVNSLKGNHFLWRKNKIVYLDKKDYLCTH